jgi:YesN/AraC family two-component response regulator
MQKDTVLQMDYELNSSKHVIKNKFFMDIAEGLSLQQNYLHKKAEFLKIDIPKDEYRVVGLFIDNFNHAIRKCPIKERNLLQYAISNILEEMIQPIKNITFFSYSDDTYIILYWDNDSNIIIKQKMMDTLKEFQEKIVEYLHISISACISSYYTNITNLKKALDEVRGLRNGYFYLGTRTIMTPQQYQFNNISESLAKKYLDDFRNAINTYDKSIINQYLKEWYEEIIKKNYEPNNVKELFKRVFIDVGALANKHGIKVDELDYDADTFETYQNNLISAVNNVLLRIEQEKNISSRKEINDVIKYIEKNIGEPINCELMANHVNMNSSYFSRLFKQEVGVSFSEYLINKRIERATDLLINTNLTIEEIAQAVGIENVSYFYRIYKKVTGKTPREIREAK